MDWSYHGETAPEYWVEVERNSECGGDMQSPVNILDFHAKETNDPDELILFYSPETHMKKVSNNGHTVQFDFMTGDSIHYNGTTYSLVQIHFHEHAEHLIGGIVYPIEIHLVHVSEKGRLTVLAVLGREGEESQIFKLLESFLPIEMGASKVIDVTCDLDQILPSNKTFYSYSGSLTTPPCTEGVNWVIFKEPITLSWDEVERLKENMPLDNYRNEQPLNGRVIQINS